MQFEAIAEEQLEEQPIAVKAREVSRLTNDLKMTVKMLDDNRRLTEENANLKKRVAHLSQFATHISWCQSLNVSVGLTGLQPPKTCNCGLSGAAS